MHEIFDDFIWTKQKKIITKNKHGVPGLGNVSYFNNNSASPPSRCTIIRILLKFIAFSRGITTLILKRAAVLLRMP